MSTAASDAAGTRLPSFLGDLPLAERAAHDAARLHAGQRRESDRSAFLMHPLEVGSLLYNAGADDEVVAAGILHDAVEKTDATRAQLHDRYGDRVGALVDAVTEDDAIEDYEARKRDLRQRVRGAGADATRLYAADKVAKARELRARLSHLREDPSSPEELARRLAHYQASLEMLEGVRPEDPLVRQLRFELETLAALPPGPPGAP